MIQTPFELYSWNTPNGQKIVIALEEAGAKYTCHPIDITKGEQHTPEFKSLSPDGKIPALVSHTQPPITLFESGAILLHLAECFPILNGLDHAEQALVQSWTFWQVGQLGPLAGQYGRFKGKHNADPATIEHFEQLVWRCLTVLDKRLSESPFLAGDRFTVADIASLTWVMSPQSYLEKFNFPWRENCPALRRWGDVAMSKPSVATAFGITR